MDSSEIKRNLPRCEDAPHPFSIAIFKYKNDTVREAIHHVKYRGNISIIDRFGEIAFEEIVDRILSKKDSDEKLYIVPIPLSQKRYMQRGFNQSELIACSIIKNDNKKRLVHSPQTLKRVLDTQPQTKLTMSKRHTNVKNCFAVSKKETSKVKGETVILIDDVTTTGSTLREARKVLLEVGVKEVWAVTLAH